MKTITLKLPVELVRQLSFTLEQHLITIDQEPEQLAEALGEEEGCELDEHRAAVEVMLDLVNEKLEDA
jgi:hypothetical protein